MSASMQTRINLLDATRETGELTPNERRELMGYPPVEGGDERQVSLNYVKAKDQSKYQTGDEAPQSNEPKEQEKQEVTEDAV